MPDRDPLAAARANMATLIALFGLLLGGAALVGLVALVMPQFLGVLLVVAALFVAPMIFHYLVWGWWLSQMKDDPPDKES